MTKIPLTTNGKVDRKALPEPETTVNANNYEAPRNEPEKKIASIWQEVLGVDRIGINDNFFDLGGDSITAIRVTTRMTKSELDLTMDKLFLHQTIRKISDNEFQKKGQKEVCAAAEIPKTKENNRRTATHLTGLKDEITAPEQQEISSSINKIHRLSTLLKQNKIVNQYQLAPVQRSFLQSPHDVLKQNIILCPYNFNQFDDAANLKNVIIRIINENSLLKSIIVKEKNTYLIKEFDSFLNVEIPFIDISRYSPKSREKTLYMVKQKLYEPFEILNHLLYRVIAVKLDHNKYKVFFAFNHMIFDGQSVGVLSQKIQTNKENPRNNLENKEKKQPAKDYPDYITFLNGLNYEDIKLEKYLDLEDYSRSVKKAVKKFQIGELKYDGLEIDIKNLNQDFRDYYNEIILLCYANLIKDLYGVIKVPMLFMSNGRSYKNGNFSNVIGDFHDLIPVHMSFENGTPPQEIIEKFINYREYIRNHNLNFINYLSKNIQVMEILEKNLLSPFIFNPIIGAYHFYKDRYKDQFSKKWAKKNIEGPFFELYMSKDFYSSKIFIYYSQNSTLTPGEIKNQLIKNFEVLVQQLNKSHLNPF
jgi:aryl carrier-like protein